jgi:hypothetical protein
MGRRIGRERMRIRDTMAITPGGIRADAEGRWCLE